METASLLAVVVAVVGLFAEAVRRMWKRQDERKAKRETDKQDRSDSFDRGDPTGLFNRPPR
jgi:hypothetical protein